MTNALPAGTWRVREMIANQRERSSKNPWSKILIDGADGNYGVTVVQRKVYGGNEDYSEIGPVYYSTIHGVVRALANLKLEFYAVLKETTLVIPEVERPMISGLIERFKEEAKKSLKMIRH